MTGMTGYGLGNNRYEKSHTSHDKEAALEADTVIVVKQRGCCPERRCEYRGPARSWGCHNLAVDQPQVTYSSQIGR